MMTSKVLRYGASAFILVLGLSTSAQTSVKAQPSFDVASIRPDRGSFETHFNVVTGGFQATNVTTRFLIEYAYNIKDYQLSGATGWVNSERYDLNAKASPAQLGQPHTTTIEQQVAQTRLMLQSLLAERFQLTMNRETKDLPVYELSIGRQGPLFTSAKPSLDPGTETLQLKVPMVRSRRGQITMTEAPLSALAEALSEQLGKPVLDKTEVIGKWDISLQWSPDSDTGQSGTQTTAIPGLVTALEEQLGLKLGSGKGPVDAFRIEHIERPSEN